MCRARANKLLQYCSETEDVAKLKLLLDTIESYIYSIPGLNEEYDLPGRPYVRKGENQSLEWRQYQLQELQGAYLAIVLQYWTGNAIARTRVRQQRFPRIVAVSLMLPLDRKTPLIDALDLSPLGITNYSTFTKLCDKRPAVIQELDPHRIMHSVCSLSLQLLVTN